MRNRRERVDKYFIMKLAGFIGILQMLLYAGLIVYLLGDGNIEPARLLFLMAIFVLLATIGTFFKSRIGALILFLTLSIHVLLILAKGSSLGIIILPFIIPVFLIYYNAILSSFDYHRVKNNTDGTQ